MGQELSCGSIEGVKLEIPQEYADLTEKPSQPPGDQTQLSANDISREIG
jgi:hypothetical protein